MAGKWVQVDAPVTRFKGLNFGRRGKVSAFGGVTAPYVGAVGCDYDTRQFIIWDESNPGGLRLPWGDVDPDGFDAFVHIVNGIPRLKIWCAHWQGDGQQQLALYDTGREYHE